MQRLRTKITRPGVASMMWISNKIFRHGIHGLFLEEKGLKRVQDLLSNENNNRVIFVPIFKSIVDFWVHIYIY